jgi:hypothetical protein
MCKENQESDQGRGFPSLFSFMTGICSVGGPEEEKQPIREHLEQQFRIIFERLNVVNTQEALTAYV